MTRSFMLLALLLAGGVSAQDNEANNEGRRIAELERAFARTGVTTEYAEVRVSENGKSLPPLHYWGQRREGDRMTVVYGDESGERHLFTEGGKSYFYYPGETVEATRSPYRTRPFELRLSAEQSMPHGIDDFTYRKVGEAIEQGVTVDVVEFKPRFKSGFDYYRAYIDASGRKLRVDFFKGSRVAERLTISYQNIGRTQKPAKLRHVTLGKRGVVTELTFSWKIGFPIERGALSERNLASCCEIPR